MPSTVQWAGSDSIFLTQFLEHLILSPNILGTEMYAFESNLHLLDISTMPASFIPGQFAFYALPLLQSFDVDPTFLVGDPLNPGNPLPAMIQSIDGVIYSADGQTLLFYPDGKLDSSFRIPDGVTRVSGQWTSNSHLKRLIIPGSITSYEGAQISSLMAVQLLDSTNFGYPYWMSSGQVFSYQNVVINDCTAEDGGTPSAAATAMYDPSNGSILKVCERSAPDFTLSNSNVTLNVGDAVDTNNTYSIITTNSVVWYSITPDPASIGLTFDPSSGLLSGNANTAAAGSQFTITGSNGFGDATRSLTISVNSVTPPQGFACDGNNSNNGTYQVNNGVLQNLNDCQSEAVVLDASVTQINYATYIPESVRSISIPESVTSIQNSPFANGMHMTEFIVDPNNPNFTAIDGVLYSKDETRILAYPANKADTSYAMGQSTTTVDAYAFSSLRHLTSISVPASVSSGLEYAFFGNGFGTPLAEVLVDPANQTYTSVDGILFSHDLTYLKFYPPMKRATTYTVPATVTHIGSLAVAGNDFLQEVILPPNLLTIEGYGFFGDAALTTVSPLPASLDVSSSQWMFYNNTALQAINVDSSHLVDDPQHPGTPLPATIKSIDGVLFSIDGTSLYEYPGGKANRTYVVPNGVQNIQSQWTSNQHLERLFLPASLTSYGSGYLQLKFVTIANSSNLAAQYGNWSHLFGYGQLFINDCNAGSASSNIAQLETENNVTVVCETQAPHFSLSNSAVSVQQGTAVNSTNSYQVNSTVAPLVYSISPSITGLGLSFNQSTGLLSGTAQNLTSATQFTVTGSNTQGDLNETFTVEVVAAPVDNSQITITSPESNSTINGVVGSAFTQAIEFSGGTAPFAVYVTSGTLPDGLSMNANTGLISGTPTTSGSFTVDITIQDSADVTTAITQLTFQISPAEQEVQPQLQPPVEWVSPVQTATVSSTTLDCSTTPATVNVQGSFAAKISNIDINGVSIDSSKWIQTANSLSITPPSNVSGKLTIQIYNGSNPVMAPLSIEYLTSCAASVASTTVAPVSAAAETPAKTTTPVVTQTPEPSPVVVPTPAPTPTPATTTAKPVVKAPVVKKPVIKTIVCVKGKSTKTIKGTNPKCPKGYTLKKK